MRLNNEEATSILSMLHTKTYDKNIKDLNLIKKLSLKLKPANDSKPKRPEQMTEELFKTYQEKIKTWAADENEYELLDVEKHIAATAIKNFKGFSSHEESIDKALTLAEKFKVNLN